MKPPHEWDEQYLQQLPIGEFDWLEVKGRRALDLSLSQVKENEVRDRLSRAISAFANSGGGVLAFGLADPKDQWQIDDGGIELAVKGRSTREWLEDVIPNLVQLPLQHFNVYVIRASCQPSAIGDNRGVFVIDIRDSPSAPHQAADHRYYARVAGKSRPIGHQLVADIFNRRQYPEIHLKFEVELREERPSTPVHPYLPFSAPSDPRDRRTLKIAARDPGRVLAKYVSAAFWIPAELLSWEIRLRNQEQSTTVDENEYYVFGKDNTQRDIVGFDNMVPRYGASWFDPILPQTTRHWRIELVDGTDPLPPVPPIRWKVYADNAAPRSGEIELSEVAVRHHFPPPPVEVPESDGGDA